MENSISIYVHWPFCLSKCPYCDFNSHVTAKVDHELWLASYQQELDYFKEYIQGKYIKSIFFGGGTPSLMDPDTVCAIINKISHIALIDQNTEITLEANPTSFEVEKFKNFKIAGINRVSIGIQSLIDKDLKKLGRNHDAKAGIKALEQAADIYPKISFDLIYAREHQTLSNWQEELEVAMQFARGHISLYQLTIEKGTPFYKLFQDGSLTIPGQDQAADMYEWTNSYLRKCGYNRYEISNYAIGGHESKHNLAYWNYDSYLGIGPGAHSRVHIDNTVRSLVMWYKPEKWLKSINESGNSIQHSIYLTMKETVDEIFMMGLRLEIGIQNDKLFKLLNHNIADVIDLELAKNYEAQGFLKLTQNNIRLTSKGLMLHSYIVPRLLTS